VAITNHGAVQVQVTGSTVGTNSINLGMTEFTFPPGGTQAVPIYFNCNRTTSFTGTVRFSAATRGGDSAIDIPVTGTVGFPLTKPKAPGS